MTQSCLKSSSNDLLWSQVEGRFVLVLKVVNHSRSVIHSFVPSVFPSGVTV